MVAPLIVRVLVLAPEYKLPLVISWKPDPVFTCHLYEIGSVLVPVTLKVALLPEQTCAFTGCPAAAIDTGVTTVSTAAFDVAGEYRIRFPGYY